MSPAIRSLQVREFVLEEFSSHQLGKHIDLPKQIHPHVSLFCLFLHSYYEEEWKILLPLWIKAFPLKSTTEQKLRIHTQVQFSTAACATSAHLPEGLSTMTLIRLRFGSNSKTWSNLYLYFVFSWKTEGQGNIFRNKFPKTITSKYALTPQSFPQSVIFI